MAGSINLISQLIWFDPETLPLANPAYAKTKALVNEQLPTS